MASASPAATFCAGDSRGGEALLPSLEFNITLQFINNPISWPQWLLLLTSKLLAGLNHTCLTNDDVKSIYSARKGTSHDDPSYFILHQLAKALAIAIPANHQSQLLPATKSNTHRELEESHNLAQSQAQARWTCWRDTGLIWKQSWWTGCHGNWRVPASSSLSQLNVIDESSDFQCELWMNFMRTLSKENCKQSWTQVQLIMNIPALCTMFVVNLRSTSSVTLDLTALARHQLQLETS